MKLAVGKSYNTRNGIGYATIEGVTWDVFRGHYHGDSGASPQTWQANGRVYYSGKPHPHDLMSER